MKYILVFISMITYAQAEEIIPVDKAAHFGVSFALNTVAYATCKSVFGQEHKTACIVSSVIFTSAIGIAKEVADGKKNTASEHRMDLLADGLGIAASTLTIKLAF